MRPLLKWSGPEPELNPMHLKPVELGHTSQGERVKSRLDQIDASSDPNHWLNVQNNQEQEDQNPRNGNFMRKKTTYKFSSSSKFKIKPIRPFSESKRDFKSRPHFQWDVNYKIGESGKHLKKQVMKRMEEY